jgi:Domain of unknown function (DUF4157)
MKTPAVKEPSNTHQRQALVNRAVIQASRRSLSSGVLQRQTSCACGGGCPRCQTKLNISEPGDKYEEEADHIADEVMRMPEPSVQRQIEPEEEEEEEMVQRKAIGNSVAPSNLKQGDPGVPFIVHKVLNSPGQPLDRDTLTFMESRFGNDFSHVRVHTDQEATQLSRALHAQAFTYQQDIYFGAGKFPGKNALTAHELTHVLQQSGGNRNPPQYQKLSDPLEEPTIQRVVEVRPPGRGEASAFDRRQELIDRLNTLSAAIQYRLDGRQIAYDVIDEGALTHFDRQMRGFIDRAEVAPMRLITSAGLVGGQNILVDFFDLGYVDLDDLLASDDGSFQMNLIHILVERFRVQNYARRIGTNFSNAEFDRAHQAGIEAETELLRDVLGDPTIRFIYEETRPNGTNVFGFQSQEGYWVFHVFRRAGQGVRGGNVFVQTQDRRRLTIEEFRAEREAAPVVP